MPEGGGRRWPSRRSASSTATSAPARSTRSRSASRRTHGVAPTPENVLGRPLADLLVAQLRRLVQVPRASSCGPTTAARAASSRCSRWSGRAAQRAAGAGARWSALGLFGAALLYGDGVITPAISVLGAVEGLERRHARAATAGSCRSRACILRRALHGAAARHGAASGAVFGPVMVVWFIVASRVLGRPRASLRHPDGARGAQSAGTRCDFFLRDGLQRLPDARRRSSWCVTGGEALYADMGHFGQRPIRLAWFAVVLPRCCSTTSGRAALLLRRPAAAAATRSTRWCRAGRCTRWSCIATAAAVVASQALISGAFSLTQQAMQLGLLPAGDDRPHLADGDRGRSTSRR